MPSASRTSPAWATERRLGAVVGVLSAAAGLAVSEVFSGFFHQRVSPVVAVAESILRLTPGAVDERVIGLVGHHDKAVLIGTTLVGLTVVSAAVGVLAMRSVLAGEGAFLVMGVVLVRSVHDRLTPSTSTYIPAVVGVVVAIAVLALLAPAAQRAAPPRGDRRQDRDEPISWAPLVAIGAPEPGEREEAARELSRRRFLEIAGVVAAASLALGVTGRVLAHSRAAVEAARRRLRLPITRPFTPQGADLGVDGVAPWLTEQQDFYRIDTALAIPQILPTDWQLRVHGMVDHELTLTYQDLLDRGLENAWITLCCVSNPVGGNLISNARFSGVRIADVLADAGPHPDADAVLSRSADNWTAGTPLAALTDGRDAMFAVAMNGEPLTPEHGFPVRMVVPGLYGYVSGTKWVVDLEVTRFDLFSAFWTERGWSEKGPIKTESRIDVPDNGASVHAGDVVVAGVAWAQDTGIDTVEVRIGDGDWQQAQLATEPSIDSWRQWRYAWQAQPGTYDVAVRATDASGYTQTGQEVGVVPDGATGWHTISVTVT